MSTATVTAISSVNTIGSTRDVFGFDACDEFTERDALQWLANNERRVRSLCVYACRGRYDLIDDLFSECIDRVSMSAKTYNPISFPHSNFDLHILNNLRFYLWKYMTAKMRDSLRYVRETDLAANETFSREGTSRERLSIIDALHVSRNVVHRKDTATEQHIIETQNAVQYILDKLAETCGTEYAAFLVGVLECRHVDDMTFEEMADFYRVSRGTAQNWYYEAIEACRDVVWGTD